VFFSAPAVVGGSVVAVGVAAAPFSSALLPSGKRSTCARARAARSRMVLSSNHKAGGIIVVANTDTATPTLLLLSFAFAVVPMDGLGQFHGMFFGRTAL
jgi:hypothetical protein